MILIIGDIIARCHVTALIIPCTVTMWLAVCVRLAGLGDIVRIMSMNVMMLACVSHLRFVRTPTVHMPVSVRMGTRGMPVQDFVNVSCEAWKFSPHVKFVMTNWIVSSTRPVLNLSLFLLCVKLVILKNWAPVQIHRKKLWAKAAKIGDCKFSAYRLIPHEISPLSFISFIRQTFS